MQPTGEWSKITMQGNVHLKEGDRSGEAQQAVFTKPNQTAVLTGQALARDTSSETHAAKITFNQATGEFSPKETFGPLTFRKTNAATGARPTNLSWRMEANSKTGRALYTATPACGRGLRCCAESIELLRDARVVNGCNVRCLSAGFLQRSISTQKTAESLAHFRGHADLLGLGESRETGRKRRRAIR